MNPPVPIGDLNVGPVSAYDRCWCGADGNYFTVKVVHAKTNIVLNAHDAVLAQFECQNCQKTVWRTYEMTGKGGKKCAWGISEHFEKTMAMVSADDDDDGREFSFAQLEHIFQEMWDGDEYRYRGNNCVHWAQLFMAKLPHGSEHIVCP